MSGHDLNPIDFKSAILIAKIILVQENHWKFL